MDPFIGQINIFGFDFPPRGWAACDGQLLSIAQNAALFSLLGTTYGGDGRVTFGLPNLQGRAPLHWGQGAGLSPYSLGEAGGVANVTLQAANVPAHSHGVVAASGAAGATTPTNNAWAAGTGRTPPPQFQSGAPNAQMLPTGPAGGGQPHNNLQPYLTLNFCIALVGVFPARG